MNIFTKCWRRLWCLHVSTTFTNPVYALEKEKESKNSNGKTQYHKSELIGYNYKCNDCEKIIYKERKD